MRQLESFNPVPHTFAYRLSKYDCFRKKTGKCSLLLTDKEFRHYVKLEPEHGNDYGCYKESSVHYCRKMAEDIRNKGILDPVEISQSSCGHYQFTDGQHRICIAKIIRLTDVPAYISSPSPYPCRVCYFKKSSLKFRLLSLLGRTTEFLG